MKMKVEVNPGSVNGTPEKMRCGRVLSTKHSKLKRQPCFSPEKRA